MYVLFCCVLCVVLYYGMACLCAASFCRQEDRRDAFYACPHHCDSGYVVHNLRRRCLVPLVIFLLCFLPLLLLLLCPYTSLSPNVYFVVSTVFSIYATPKPGGLCVQCLLSSPVPCPLFVVLSVLFSVPTAYSLIL